MGKILSLDELSSLTEDLREQGRKVVLCHGVFDLLHPGHTLYLEEAKSQGDILVVSVTCDRFVNKGPGRPIFGQDIRMKELAAREIVDYVVLSEYSTGVEVITRVRPAIYAKGPDYSTGILGKEKEAIKSVGGAIYITNTPIWSSSSLINRYLNAYPPETTAFLERLKQSHTSNSIVGKLQALKDLRVLIIGDTIIDEYVYCDVLGASPKDNILTARYQSEERFAGGVLAVANHIAGFCDQVHLISLIGKEHTPFIQEHLQLGIAKKLFELEGFRTIVKRRFIEPDSFRKLFSIEGIPENKIPEKLELEIQDYLEEVIRDYDLVLVSDFGHGFLTESIISTLCNEARFLAVNTQTNSANRGFNPLTKYHRIDYASLDELELRLVCLDMFGDLRDVVKSVWYSMMGCRLLSVTRGKHGSLTFTADGLVEVPSLSEAVVDTVGAGDAYLAVTSLCAARDFEPELIGFIGNAVGALKVRWVGNKESITPDELYRFITTLLK